MLHKIAVRISLSLARLAADIGFVHFDCTLKNAGKRVFSHCQPNTMGKMPSRPVGTKAKISLKL
jgi:hypothetical protein